MGLHSITSDELSTKGSLAQIKLPTLATPSPDRDQHQPPSLVHKRVKFHVKNLGVTYPYTQPLTKKDMHQPVNIAYQHAKSQTVAVVGWAKSQIEKGLLFVTSSIQSV